MLEAAIWGAVASLSLFIGSIIGLCLEVPAKINAYLMALGTGVLIGASAFDLLVESMETSGILLTSASFLGGALLFTLIEIFLYIKGGTNRKRSTGNIAANSGIAIFIGTLMDAIPESLIIGLSLIETNHVDILFIVAIFISNFPEALSSTVGLKKDGYKKLRILFLWLSVVVISALSSLIGYSFLANASDIVIASIEAFGAGGLIAMVCSTMLPEAYQKAGPVVGFISCIGLMIALGLSSMSG